MDQREQEDVYPLQLLLEAENELALQLANQANSVARKLGPQAFQPRAVPDAVTPIVACALSAAGNLNVPFNYSAFTKTMTRYARAHETSPGQYPHLDVRCLGFCFTHPASGPLVRRLIDIILGRNPMLVSAAGGEGPKAATEGATEGTETTTQQPAGATAVDADDTVDDEKPDENDPDAVAEYELRQARRRMRHAVDPGCLTALEHNLGIRFDRKWSYVVDVRVKRGEQVRLGDGGPGATAALIDIDAEGFRHVLRSGSVSAHRPGAPKTTRAAELKVLVAAGKLPKLRRGASAPKRAKSSNDDSAAAPREDRDVAYETRTISQISVTEPDLITQVQGSHDALRALLQLSLDRTGVKMKSGVLVRTVMTQFINANHLAPIMSLFEVILRSELPPEASASERVAIKVEKQRQQTASATPPADAAASEEGKPRKAANAAEPTTSAASPRKPAAAAVDCECQTSPLPTKVRVVYVERQHATTVVAPPPAQQHSTAQTQHGASSARQPSQSVAHKPQPVPTARPAEQPTRRAQDSTPARADASSTLEASADLAAVASEVEYAATVIQRNIRGKLVRMRLRSSARDTVHKPTPAAAAPTKDDPVKSTTLSAGSSASPLHGQPVAQQPQRAWFETTPRAATPERHRTAVSPDHGHRAGAATGAVSGTKPADSRGGVQERRALPSEDRSTLAPPASSQYRDRGDDRVPPPPQQRSSTPPSAQADTTRSTTTRRASGGGSPGIAVTDESGLSTSQVEARDPASKLTVSDNERAPQHHAMPRVAEAPRHRQSTQLPAIAARPARPVPVAAASDDVRPELQPVLFQMAAKYQLAIARHQAAAAGQGGGGAVLPPLQQRPLLRRAPGVAKGGADGAPYTADIEVALGLKKSKAALERDEVRRRMQGERDYFDRHNPAHQLAKTSATPPPAPEPRGDVGAMFKKPVQRPPQRPGAAAVLSPLRQRAKTVTPSAPASATATVGGVPFEQLSRNQQRAVVQALAASLLDSEAAARSPPRGHEAAGSNAADDRRREGVARHRDRERDFNDFLLDQQQRALFEGQREARHNPPQAGPSAGPVAHTA